MIEFCTKKRMLLACGLLISVSVAMLVIEAYLEADLDVGTSANSDSDESMIFCGKANTLQVSDPCQPCSQFEKKAKSYCNTTGYKEKYSCSSKTAANSDASEESWKSCAKPLWDEIRDFLVFEGVTITVGVVAFIVVFVRQKKLDKLLLDKVNKQIAAGV